MSQSKPGRNDPCPCGSGKKYKQCCLVKDEAQQRDARSKAAEEAPQAEPASSQAAATTPAHGPRHPTQQPWKRGPQNTRGFQKFSAPRKVGG